MTIDFEWEGVEYRLPTARAQFNYDEELEDERIHDDPEEGPT